jgi:hypothetical protein
MRRFTFSLLGQSSSYLTCVDAGLGIAGAPYVSTARAELPRRVDDCRSAVPDHERTHMCTQALSVQFLLGALASGSIPAGIYVRACGALPLQISLPNRWCTIDIVAPAADACT